VKPLFYTREGGSFAFASEIKALVGAHGIPFRPSAPVVYDFLVVGMLPEPQSGLTFFEGVSSLPPGHLMRVAGDRCEVVRYYTPPARSRAAEDADPGAVVREYGELLADSVKLRLRSDVPVGSCLSGGLDSSSIVCLVNGMVEAKVGAAAVGEHQKAFSAVYEAEGAFNERKHIETVLRATGAEANYTYPTVEGLIADAERMVWHQDEPFLSTSIYAQWCVMAKVRERGVTVLLDGQGADEALAGYRPFDIHISGLLRAGRLGRAASELRAMQTVTGVAPAGVLMRSLVRQLPEGLITAARAYRLRRPARFVRQELGGLGAASLPGGERDLQHHLTEQVVNGSLPNLLRYEDRNSMAFSVEARVPFVDYRLIEFSLTRTEGVRIRDGWTKWVLRQAMKGVIPEEIAWRRDKVGFETPERPWITEFLRSRPGLFDDGALSGQYLELAAVRAEVERWLAEGGDARRIWRWINLELWLGVWGRN
jgi:asparagine synthase (glutamine-hydrolysing)